MRKIVVDAKSEKNVISRNIYGHFSEHLGRCIYQGIFVGDDPEIPNVNGMRTDEAVESILNMFVNTRNNRDFIQLIRKRKVL